METPQQIGRYEIVRELGRGGMAIVYLARDPLMGRQVALKLLPGQLNASQGLRQRFRQEAQIVASLEHPSIVPVHDFGEYAEQPYLVMRYMTGGSLSNRLQGRPLSLAQTVTILDPLCSALDKAHDKHVIHRDLKPDNILFDGDENPYLSDFGIARLTEGTQTQSIMGTPAYMSPEQITGSGDLDPRSDIYALGVILFEMLTGQQPYKADTPTQMMMKHVMEPVPNILEADNNLPPASQGIIDRAMAKERDDRYSTADELLVAVRALHGFVEAGGAPIIGDPTVVQETKDVTPSPVHVEPTVVEPPDGSQAVSLAVLYAQLQTAANAGDWVETMALGAKIQREDANYRDVSTIVSRAQTELTQPRSTTSTGEETVVEGWEQAAAVPAATGRPAVAPPEEKKGFPIWILAVGGVVVLAIVAFGIFSLFGGGDDEPTSVQAVSSADLSGLAVSETDLPPTEEVAAQATATVQPSPTTRPPTMEPEQVSETEPEPVAEQSTVLFEDDFSGAGAPDDWDLYEDEVSSFSIADGKLVAEGRDAETFNWTRHLGFYEEFDLTIGADIVDGGRSAFFGAVFVDSSDNYVGCLVQGDNSAYCAQQVDGEATFDDWVQVDLSVLRSNPIRFVIAGGQWALFVNDQCIGSGTRPTDPSGQVGLLVSTNDNERPARVAYDDILIRTPDEESRQILGCTPVPIDS